MKKINETLRDEFRAKNKAAIHSNLNNNKPAHDFAEITGVEGVAGHWKLPGNISLDELQQKLFRGGFNNDEADFLKEVIELNPELKELDFKDYDHFLNTRNFLTYVAQGFNKHDIGCLMEEEQYDINHTKNVTQLREQIGIAPTWRVDPQTLQMIRGHFNLPKPKTFLEHAGDALDKLRSSGGPYYLDPNEP